ncbi:hypothetical protein H4R20_001556 [Coemansia guatemalensis]|uniref:DUF4211 domain-containing protein n=1 Tax=Coemansia guatemalensis TaxID=2761395 RepID=A0A9W8HZ91_9FUNG|nr:hypothetical protein H4R20_001556 [Coemansia guatemalensis]
MEHEESSVSRDEWSPPEDEIGLKVVQSLRRSGSNVRARGMSAHKRTENLHTHFKDRSPRKRAKTDPIVDVISQQEDRPTASTKEDHDKRDAAKISPKPGDNAALTEQQKDITSMFTDTEGEGDEDDKNQMPSEDIGDAADFGSQEVVIQACADDAATRGVEDQAPYPLEQMDFMDEESAANYRRLLEQSKRAYQNSAAQRITRQEQPKQANSENSIPASSSPESPAAQHIHIQQLAERDDLGTDITTSIDGLPDDPLEDISTTALDKHSQSSHIQPLHRLHRRPYISDSETTNEDMASLDQGTVIEERLRRRPAVSAARNRVEQARRSINQPSYESDSDFETISKGTDKRQIESFLDDTVNENPLLDMPETDSEPERKRSSTVLVIHGSSDEDDDFVSDPDDLPEPHDALRRSAPRQAALDNFWTAFDMRRRPQTKHRNQHPEPLEVSEKASPKLVKGYSQELDDDLADFIVDDEYDESEPAENIDRSSDSIDGANTELTSNHPARPTSGSDRLHSAMVMMPEEFSQLDLPTSFKTYTQYLVHWICNGRHKPELNSENKRYFYLAYIAVTRVIDSLEQSVVASSAWVEDFCNALYRYPDYTSGSIASVPGCEACHFRQNRTATFYVEFFGTPYSRSMLAPPQPGESPIFDKGQESNSIASEVSSVVSVDSDISSQPQHISFNVGRTCKKRSAACHELHHYCYHLLLKIDIALKPLLATAGDSGVIDPDDLVSILDEQGTIDNLFDDFKSMLSRAKSEFVS